MAPKANESHTVKPRTENQKRLAAVIDHYDFFLINGGPGTGKSIYVIGVLCEMFKRGRINKIVIVRSSNHIIKEMGFPAGQYKEKCAEFFVQQIVYLKHFLGESTYRRMSENNEIELMSTSILRGLNYEFAGILLDECQHSSKEDIILSLSRVGKNSIVFLAGDEMQNNTGFFGRMYEQIEDEKLFKIRFDESDCLRHKDMIRLCKKVQEIK